jgi:hypothetical protein
MTLLNIQSQVVQQDIRSINEICIDADNNKRDLLVLREIKKEVIQNLKKYPLYQAEYMIEHIDNLVHEEISNRRANHINSYFDPF